MKKFSVLAFIHTYKKVIIEAENEDEAEDIAYGQLHDAYHGHDVEITDVYEVGDL